MFVDSVNLRCILSFSCLICATVISCAPLFDTNINHLLWHIFRFDGLCFRSCLWLGLKTFLSLCVDLNRNWLYCTGVHANMGTHKYRRSALSGQRLYSVVKVTAKQGQTQWSEETRACSLFILPQEEAVSRCQCTACVCEVALSQRVSSCSKEDFTHCSILSRRECRKVWGGENIGGWNEMCDSFFLVCLFGLCSS